MKNMFTKNRCIKQSADSETSQGRVSKISYHFGV